MTENQQNSQITVLIITAHILGGLFRWSIIFT